VKRSLPLLVLALALLLPASARGPSSLPSLLRIGVYDNPPKIGVTASGKPYGFHIDLLDAILEGSGVSPDYVAGTWEECLARLERGEIDMMPDMAYSEERAKLFEFNSESALLNWAVVYAAEPGAVSTITDLDGKRVAVMRDSIHTSGQFGIVNMAADFEIRCDFIYVDSYEECFNRLRAGQADAAVVNRLFGLMNESGENSYRTPLIFNPSQIRYAFAQGKPENEALIALFDARLKRLKERSDGAYHRAFARYLTPYIAKEKELPSWISNAILLILGLSLMLLLFLFAIKSKKEEKVNITQFFRSYRSMWDIRTGIADSTILAYSLFSIPMMLSILYHVLTLGDDPFAWFYLPALILIGMAALLRKRLKVDIKLYTLLFSLFYTGSLVLVAQGDLGIGFSYFFSAGILATMFYGRRWGLAALTAGLVVSVGFGLLVVSGSLDISHIHSSYFHSTSSWIFAIVSFLMMFFTLMSGLQKFYDSLIDAVENLEKRIEERTKDIDTINKSLQVEIREHEKTEVLLEASRQEAENANKAKSYFFAGMSHEIRTPLNAILGYSQILLRDKELSGESRRELETINASGEHLLSLINEVLEMSRIEAGKLEAVIEPCDVAAVLREVGNMFAGSAAKKGIALTARALSDMPGRVMTDESKLKQILINLVGNALKFTDSGSVELTASAEPGNPGRLSFAVADTGRGIAAADVEKIFQPFEQTEEGRSMGGTGLGLPISQKYCQLLGGTIGLESQVGRGSRFSFSIDAPPCPESLPDKAGGDARIGGITKGTPPRVLIVDDRETNRDILARMLEPLGFPVAQAAGGSEALAMLDTWNPGLILLDLVMPGMNGKDFLRIVRTDRSKAAIRIIVITASVLEDERSGVIELGADAFIRKPFREKHVLEEIGRLMDIEYWYEEEKDKVAETASPPADLAAGLAGLPAGLAGKLRDSIRSGDLEEVLALAKEAANFDKALSAAIVGMAEGFQINLLLDLAGRGDEA